MIVTFVFVLTVVLIIELVICVPSSTPRYEYREECRVWDNVTSVLNKQPDVTMNCWNNDICTGFQCNGKYSYSGLYALGSSVQVDFCYGMFLHPCAQPLELHFFVDMPDQHSTFEKTVQGNDTIALPGVHYDLGSIGSADGFVQVDMLPQTRFGRPYVQLGLTFKVRVSAMMGTLETWPDAMQRKLMPDTLVPVPECDPLVPVPHETGHTCSKYHTTTPSTGGSVTGKTTPYTTQTTTLAGRQCQVDLAKQCGNYEMCVPITDTEGVCRCIPDYEPDQTGSCQSFTTTMRIIPYPIPEHVHGKNKAHKNAVIIGSCVAAAVIVVAILLFVIIVVYRKHRARYAQHDILLSNTDDGDDDPIDIST